MTFSFNLVLGLFLLAPGFAVFAGVYHSSHLGPVRSPPPPPGSILALSIVSLGALVAHFLGALLFLAQDWACPAVRACLKVGFNPNAYSAIFNLAADKATPLPPAEIVEVLATLIAVTACAFFITQAIVRTEPAAGALKNILYGWLSGVAIAAGEDQAVLAYVLSDVQEDGAVVGYEGVVANMTTNADKEITSILMIECETFYLHVAPKGVFRRTVARENPIPQLYLDRSRIKNIAFEFVRLAPAGAAAQ